MEPHDEVEPCTPSAKDAETDRRVEIFHEEASNLAHSPLSATKTLQHDVFALFDLGINLEHIETLFGDRVAPSVLRDFAKQWTTKASVHGLEKLSIAQEVLSRSTSALDKEDFRKMLISGYEEIPERLTDPLTFALMDDPVVLSSGYVLDRSSALNESGELRFQNCPFTRRALSKSVYRFNL